MDSESTAPGFVAPYRFAIIPEWILYSPELESPQVHLFGILVRFGGRIFPGYATLAEQMRRSVSSIRRDMAALEKAGAIHRTPRFRPDGGQTSNLYHLAGSAPFEFGDLGGVVADDQGGLVADDTPLNESKKERETETSNEVSSRDAASQLALVDDPFFQAIQSPVMSAVELNEIKKAITDVCGEPPTKTGWALVNRLATFIRDRGDPPESVALRATLMAQEWGPGKVTVASLEKHWTRYDEGRIGRLSQEDIDEYHREMQDLKFRRQLQDMEGDT